MPRRWNSSALRRRTCSQPKRTPASSTTSPSRWWVLERLAPGSGYFQAKLLQESLISSGPIPYTIVRATQFFEFLSTIADSATVGDTVPLPPALIQPMASADVAEGVAIAAVGAPVNGITEIGGPAPVRLDEVIRTVLTAHGDARRVVPDPEARYWGIAIEGRNGLGTGCGRGRPSAAGRPGRRRGSVRRSNRPFAARPDRARPRAPTCRTVNGCAGRIAAWTPGGHRPPVVHPHRCTRLHRTGPT